MTWEGFTQWLTDISNNPVFISVISILSALLSVLVIISKTSIGRKAIKLLTNMSRETNNKVVAIYSEVNGKLKLLDEKLVEIEEERKELTEKAEIFFNLFSFYENEMINICELIPNKKVQDKVALFKQHWPEAKKEIEKFIGIDCVEYQNKLSDLQHQIEELKDGRVIDNSRESEEI